MLILPLHRSLNRNNFPFVTFALIVVNVFVFAFLQSGDERTEKRAVEFYGQSQLPDVEGPAYAEWLRSHGGDPRKIEFAEHGPAEARVALIQSDPKFLVDLHAGRIIASSDARYPAWHHDRDAFEAILESSFTESHAVRFSHVEPARIGWAMFLHGGLEHLLGNMIFLAIIGMLVEGALGPGWFLGLYLLGGVAAASGSLWWHWGDEGGALGASGAIASLMGAYCVIWGLRKVRVFYWFFIVFDYVKVPALVVLPFWLGWEVLNLLLNRDAHIGFDQHASGIMAGAAMAFVLRRSGRVRDAFVEEDERVEENDRTESDYAQAQQYLGQLDIAKARPLFDRIDKAHPGQLRILVALYRCARYRGVPAEMDAAAARVFAFTPANDADAREIGSVYQDYAKACAGQPRLAPTTLLGVLPSLLRVGDDAAEALLRDLANAAPDSPGLAPAWFQLAMRSPDGSSKRRSRLQYLLDHHAASEFAPKARFLLGDG